MIFWNRIADDEPISGALVIARDAQGLVLRGKIEQDIDGWFCVCPISQYVLDEVVYYISDPEIPEDV